MTAKICSFGIPSSELRALSKMAHIDFNALSSSLPRILSSSDKFSGVYWLINPFKIHEACDEVFPPEVKRPKFYHLHQKN